METHNRSLASVGLVQIVFGLLCVCLQVPLFVLYDGWQLFRGQTMFSAAAASFASIAGVCVFLPAGPAAFVRRTHLYVAASSCAAAACLLYLAVSVGGFVTELGRLYDDDVVDDENDDDMLVAGTDDAHFWLLALLFFSSLVVLFFSLAGVALGWSAGAGRRRSAGEEMKIFLTSQKSLVAS